MSTKTSSPGITGERATLRGALRWPAPSTLAMWLLVVIAMIAASLVGLALGTP